MVMYETFIFFLSFPSKNEPLKSLLSKWKISKPYSDRMFTANDEGMLSSLYEQAINMYNDSNSSIIIIIKLMEKQFY